MIVYEFIPDEAKPGTGGKSSLMIDGERVAEGYIPKTQPFAFSADEGADVGEDGETNVSPDYKQHDNKFTGRIYKVTIDLKEMKAANAEIEQQVVREAHVRKTMAD
jgi:arylsulfatase